MIVDIDWRRMAAPQMDNYDSEVILSFVDKDHLDKQRSSCNKTVLEGATGVRYLDVLFPEGFVFALSDHPNLHKMEQLLKSWPVGYKQCQSLVVTITPFFNPEYPITESTGSVCGPAGDYFGGIALTLDNSIGAAEAVVHEMAHHKLKVLGVEFTSANGLIVNNPKSLYKSPIRYDCERPMTAVVHAMYSYTYIAALDNAILNSDVPEEIKLRILETSLSIIIPKLRFGKNVMLNNLQTDENGQAFFAGYRHWLDETINQSLDFLNLYNVQLIEFSHPLTA